MHTLHPLATAGAILHIVHPDIAIKGPPGVWGSGETCYLFSGSWGALLIILGELGSKHILFGI